MKHLQATLCLISAGIQGLYRHLDVLISFDSNDTEKPTQSKIFSSASFSDFKPYIKPANRDEYKVPKYKIIFMSGSDGHPAPLDAILYPSLNKIYYCHRHGYTFKHAISRQYVDYFGPKFLEVGLHSNSILLLLL